MNTEALLKEFQEILAVEKKAKNLYDHYIGLLDDDGIKQQLVSIRNDEMAHIKIAEKLIEYVS